MSKWYKEVLEKDGIAVSTRVRLARNVRKLPFPKKMNEIQRREMLQSVRSLCDGKQVEGIGVLKYIDMQAVPEDEIVAMVERHIISPNFAKQVGLHGLLLNEDESVSVMLLEEDHLRIQVILPGLQAEKAYQMAAAVEALFAGGLTLAFDAKLGYLTECPTNLGTGLRASVMLHLPVLESAGALSSIADSVAKIGLTVRGTYGEGSQSHAALYQLSNQVTLGISEQAATENLAAITGQIIEKERAARAELQKNTVEDIVYRAVGVLKYARKLSSEEMMQLMSRVKLGVSMGFLKNIDPALPLKLIVETQPGTLQCQHGRMTPDERDICRAEVIRKQLEKVE